MIATIMATVLLGIALMHLAWGVGITWPYADGRSLARAVVGARNIKSMPSFTACLLAASAIAITGLWPLMLAGPINVSVPRGITPLGSTMIGLVFLARGVAPYTSVWRRLTPEQPFATLDRLAYGPLCLALAAGYLVVIMDTIRT